MCQLTGNNDSKKACNSKLCLNEDKIKARSENMCVILSVKLRDQNKNLEK